MTTATPTATATTTNIVSLTIPTPLTSTSAPTVSTTLVQTPTMDSRVPAPTLVYPNDTHGVDPRVYFGVQLDWNKNTPQEYSQLLGRIPSAFGSFINIGSTFPVDWMMNQVRQLLNVTSVYAGAKGKPKSLVRPIFHVAVLPYGGLESVTDLALQQLSQTCKQAEDLGVGVMLRWAHEMNGEWYPWGNRSTLYIATWKRMYSTLKTVSPKTVVIWSPNVWDYRLDYGSFYPGDEWVDWVGLSDYHFGNSYPYFNEIPNANKFVNSFTGHNDYYPQANFYKLFSVLRNKPFMISETAAPVAEGVRFGAGANEGNMKKAWWRQLYNTTTFDIYKNLKMILWFEFRKVEDDGTLNDHRLVTRGNATLLSEFKNDLPWDRMVFNDNRQF
ncbi:glycoside hydrolase superfamily [Paraphysoderma sedebokerense]|nr:glycoside hydrolase superfamily [Paraphysoderma sedebokerense]